MNDLERLRELIAECTAPDAPNMYRTLYGMRDGEPALHLAGWHEWIKLPLVTKDLLTETPVANRFFASNTDVEDIRTSSGTSGKTPPFILRSIPSGLEYRLQYHSFENPILASNVPCMPHWHEDLQISLGYAPRVIAFDPIHAAASVRLARIAGVDAISTFAFHVPLIGKLMIQEGIAEQIRLIEMCGESCTRSLFDFIKRTFPNATIIPQFGAAEIEDKPVGIPCRAITGEEPLSVYHTKPSHYHEIIDSEQEIVLPYEPGTEGELVITSCSPKPRATPLIRYRTGDIVRILPEKCAAHNQLQFTLIGRVSIDFIKIPGGMLRADETERVLRVFNGEITDRFELHRYLRPSSEGQKVEVILYVEPRDQNSPEVLNRLAERIAQELRVGPFRTYSEGVEDGIYLPLTCLPITSTQSPTKSKRMIAH